MPEPRQYYSATCAAGKFIITGDGRFEGRALTFSEPDNAYGMTFEPDAFDESIEKLGPTGIKMFYEHKADALIGVWDTIYRDEAGLFIKGRLALDTELAKEVKSLMESGALDGLSIGFIVQEADGDHVLKADLIEVSVVALPADPSARLGQGDGLRIYSSNSALPMRVRSLLPGDAQTIFRKAYNKYAKAHPEASAGRALAIAWRAVSRRYRAPEKEVGMWIKKLGDDAGDEFSGHFADAVELMDGGFRRTGDGYLVGVAKCARTGIQLYSGDQCGRPDLKVVRVYRPADQVFDAKALASFAHKPITLDHPDDMVDAESWKRHSVGHIGDKIEFGEGFVRVPMVLMDSAAIKAVTDGKKELSMGYTCDLKWDAGTVDGQEYDAVQTDIRANHLAIVAKARGGSELRIGDNTSGKKETDMPEIKTVDVDVDGVTVQVADAQAGYLRKFISGLQEKLSKFASKMEEDEKKAKEEKDKYDAQIAAKDATISDLQGKLKDSELTPAKLDAAVKDRHELIGKAKIMLGDSLVVDGRDNADIRKQVVVAKLGDTAKAYTPEQFAIAFDTLAATNSDAKQFAAKLGDTSATADAVTKAYTDYDKDLTNRWKQGQRPAAAA